MARALKGDAGEDDKGYITARVEFELMAGPSKGSRITYNGRIDARSAPYVARDLAAVGWQGKKLETLAADIAAKPVEVPIEIQHKQTKDGTRTFAVVRSIGRGAKPLTKPSANNAKDADDLLTRALGGPESTEEAPF